MINRKRDSQRERERWGGGGGRERGGGGGGVRAGERREKSDHRK